MIIKLEDSKLSIGIGKQELSELLPIWKQDLAYWQGFVLGSKEVPEPIQRHIDFLKLIIKESNGKD